MDKHTLKLNREDALRQIGSVAPLLSLATQAYLNGKLRELVTKLLEKRTAEEKVKQRPTGA